VTTHIQGQGKPSERLARRILATVNDFIDVEPAADTAEIVCALFDALRCVLTAVEPVETRGKLAEVSNEFCAAAIKVAMSERSTDTNANLH
jgi:hypothetical protein